MLILAYHIAKLAKFQNNGLTIREQKNGIENFYNLLLTEYEVCVPTLSSLNLT